MKIMKILKRLLVLLIEDRAVRCFEKSNQSTMVGRHNDRLFREYMKICNDLDGVDVCERRMK